LSKSQDHTYPEKEEEEKKTLTWCFSFKQNSKT